MDTVTIRQELLDIINTANDEQVEHIYTIIKDDQSTPYEWWNDEEFVAELDQISADMDSGKDKGTSWEEIKLNLLNRPKKSES